MTAIERKTVQHIKSMDAEVAQYTDEEVLEASSGTILFAKLSLSYAMAELRVLGSQLNGGKRL